MAFLYLLELRKKVQILENLVLRMEEATIENTFDDDENLDVSLKDLFLEENLFKYLHCGYKTSSKKGLKVHETRKHKKKCNNCDKNFPSDNNLEKQTCRGNVDNFENEDFELCVHNSRLGCCCISRKNLPGTANFMLHSTSFWMNISLGSKPRLAIPTWSRCPHWAGLSGWLPLLSYLDGHLGVWQDVGLDWLGKDHAEQTNIVINVILQVEIPHALRPLEILTWKC